MKLAALLLLVGVCAPGAWPGQKVPAPATPSSLPGEARQALTPATPPSAPPPQTQQIQEGVTPRAPKPGSAEPGFLEPAQVKALLHKIWLAEFRINDLLSQVQPGKWKISDAARNSFNETLGTLRVQLQSLEDWRTQFEKRPDSMFLGFQTYIAVNAVLPRLDGVAHGITQYENASFGLQYNKAGDQLFDLQQSLQPYLSYLMRNQDQLVLAAQTNLASCQNQLGFAMRPRVEPAVPMKNIMPELKGRHVRPNGAGGTPAASTKPRKREKKGKAAAGSAQKTDAKPATKQAKK